MKDYDRVLRIIEALGEHYKTDIKCFLIHNNAWQLLIATMLSAQCTDERVNMVTPPLFQKYQSIEAFASADLRELEQAIKSTGFYRNKATNIKRCCQQLLEDYNGEVPSDVDELIKLRGVGRKTANVVRGHIYGIESIVVDTHVKRISRKLGFTSNEDPVKIEFDLMALLPKESWIHYNQRVIAHGRAICKARNPKCHECFLFLDCPWGKNNLNK